MKTPNQFVKRNHKIQAPIKVNRNIVDADKVKALNTLNAISTMKVIKLSEAA